MAVVELRTGDILWLDTSASSRMSFNDPDDMKVVTQAMINTFLKICCQLL